MFPRNLSIELVKAQMPLNKEVWTFCSFTSCERTARLKLSQTAWLILSSIYSSRPEVFLQAAVPQHRVDYARQLAAYLRTRFLF